jgi:hypothetical protein
MSIPIKMEPPLIDDLTIKEIRLLYNEAVDEYNTARENFEFETAGLVQEKLNYYKNELKRRQTAS